MLVYFTARNCSTAAPVSGGAGLRYLALVTLSSSIISTDPFLCCLHGCPLCLHSRDPRRFVGVVADMRAACAEHAQQI